MNDEEYTITEIIDGDDIHGVITNLNGGGYSSVMTSSGAASTTMVDDVDGRVDTLEERVRVLENIIMALRTKDMNDL